MCIVKLFYKKLYVINVSIEKWKFEHVDWWHICLTVKYQQDKRYMLTNLWNYWILAHFRTGRHPYWYFGNIRNNILNASCEENRPMTEFFVLYVLAIQSWARDLPLRVFSVKLSWKKPTLFTGSWQSQTVLGFHLLSLCVVWFPVWNL